MKTRQTTIVQPPPTGSPMSPLEKARQKRQEMRERGEATVRLNPIEKAAANPKSAKLAIKAKCWDCCGAGADPQIRATIGGCTVTRCPLHPHRPYQHKADSDDDN